MTAAWQSRLESAADDVQRAIAHSIDRFGRDRALRLSGFVIVALLLLWSLTSLLRGFWSLLPPAAPLSPSLQPINPALEADVSTIGQKIDIDRLVAAELFGEPGESPANAPETFDAEAAMSEAEAAVALAGIEDGAPETRLPLQLRGVVAATDAGLGQAVIEHRNEQALYRVGDELPVAGRVRVAKVLFDRVVLDNGGRYELLPLFEKTDPVGLPRPSGVTAAASPAPSTIREQSVSVSTEAAELAARYRAQLYEDPQALVDVVTVSAVRQGSTLVGYRVSPGRDRRAFEALGFQPGDLITAVNGMRLDDPANAVRLYQAMRSATQAVFELQRGGTALTLTVDLASAVEGGE